VQKFARERKPFNFAEWGEEEMQRIAPLWLLRRLPNMPASHISIAFDARGPNNTMTNRDTSALMALMEAVNVIERGAADCLIVGATGSNLQPVDLVKFCLYEELSSRKRDPEKTCRPFDLHRDGTTLGEGAAAFIVESLSHAEKRGANLYAEVRGQGARCDGNAANNTVSPGLINAVRTALRSARISPSELGHLNAQGNASPTEDPIEAASYHQVLGDAAGRVPVTALKSYFGLSDAGSGAMELAGSLLALRHGRIPATLNYETRDPRCDLNIVHGEPMPAEHPWALCVNRTRMGQTAAVVLRGF